ncbi:hypothetical protein [Leucobacter chromiireducens]|uniref:Cell division protein CrgA n=1 Tax=Leucobacter chromiireducens subsp. solipictus TaxID=398235 RepID=A0ABS1SFF0_9MICO|nr:hypothetical protein [Leucobacter chromiireducens]MBL3679042.1 hypothetical protein [Leucobacter chromiireducens subsp. solipictus]
MTNQAPVAHPGTPATPTSSASETPAQQRSPFVPNPHPRHGATTIIGFLVSAILVFGGFYMMGMAFSVPGAEFLLFAGGIIVDAIGLWVAFGLIPALADRGRD